MANLRTRKRISIFFQICFIVVGTWVFGFHKDLNSKLSISRKHKEVKEPLRELYSNSTDNSMSSTTKTILPWKVQSTTKTILFWKVPMGDYTMVQEYLHMGYIPTDLYSFSWNTEQCGNCKTTFDHALLEVSDAIVVHASFPNEFKRYAEKGNKAQKFVWWSQENRNKVPFSPRIEKYFDWTMTESLHSSVYSPYSSFPWILKWLKYKLNGADIMVNYTKIKDKKKDIDPEKNQYIIRDENPAELSNRTNEAFQQLLNKKQKLVIWISSNCRHPAAIVRKGLVDSLEASGLKIDKFGSCSSNRIKMSRWDPEFFQFISTYKFDISFESGIHCQGYITEKLWYNALYSGAVPVIWGPHRDDVEAVLPPKSYILVEDFNSVKDLVEHLKYLDGNNTAYAEYLNWRTWIKYLDKDAEYHPENLRLMEKSDQPDEKLKSILDKYLKPKPIGFCRLCRMLHGLEEPEKSKSETIINTERSECKNVQQGRDIAEKLKKGGG